MIIKWIKGLFGPKQVTQELTQELNTGAPPLNSKYLCLLGGELIEVDVDRISRSGRYMKIFQKNPGCPFDSMRYTTFFWISKEEFDKRYEIMEVIQ
jgi:hypothetical protein